MCSKNLYTQALLKVSSLMTEDEFILLSKWEIASCNGESLSVLDIDISACGTKNYISTYDDFLGKRVLYQICINKTSSLEEISVQEPDYDEYRQLSYSSKYDRCHLLNWLCMISNTEIVMHPKLKRIEELLRQQLNGLSDDYWILEIERDY